jgi:short-subunit dehydrogenase
VAGTTGIPEGTVYCASKFAVRGFSQSLFKELRPFNIKVSCVYPGSVNTNFFDHYPAVQVNDQFMKASDIADSIIYLLETPANILPVDLELRPMQLKM